MPYDANLPVPLSFYSSSPKERADHVTVRQQASSTATRPRFSKATPPRPNTLPLRTLPSCIPLSTPLYHRLCGLLNATSHEAALRCTIPCEDNLIHLPCHHELSEMKTQ